MSRTWTESSSPVAASCSPILKRSTSPMLETARKLIEALVEGVYYYKTRPEEGMAMLVARGIEPGTARKIYQKVADSYRPSPDPEVASVKGVLDTLLDERTRSISTESLIDAGPWEKVAKSGIIERLYGKALPTK